MISIIDGTLKMNGKGSELMAETTVILQELYQTMCKYSGEENAKAEMKNIFELALMDAEEIKTLNKMDTEAVISDEQWLH